MRMPPIQLFVLGLSLCFGAAQLNAFDAKDARYRSELKPIMQSIAGSMSRLLPYYLDYEAFSAKQNQAEIQKELETLYSRAQLIQGKTKSYGTDAHVYGANVVYETKGAYNHYKRGAFKQAHFYVEETLETCFSCHTSRSSADNSKIIDFSKIEISDAMSAFAKPKILAVSRQFDKAMDAYENLILNTDLSLGDLLYQDPFQHYLNLAIRVKNDKSRAWKLLQAAQKKNLPAGIKDNLRTWERSVEDLVKLEKTQKNPLTLAQLLIAKAQKLREYPRDQSGLIYFLEASRILKEQWETQKNPKIRAQSSYYLGIAELAIGRSLLGLEAQPYLEMAIKLQPKSDLAQKSYNLYEENLVFSYSGSAGTFLPADEKQRLAELRKLAFGR